MNSLFPLAILGAAVSAVLVPIFFGYGLAEGRVGPMLAAVVFLGIAAALFFLVGRLRRSSAPGRSEVSGPSH